MARPRGRPSASRRPDPEAEAHLARLLAAASAITTLDQLIDFQRMVARATILQQIGGYDAQCLTSLTKEMRMAIVARDETPKSKRNPKAWSDDELQSYIGEQLAPTGDAS